MLRLLFVLLLLLHGLLHLLGFVKEWQLAAVPQLTGKTLFPLSPDAARVVGLLWLVAFLLFVATGVVYLLKKEWWWMPGVAAVVLSQLLILLFWHDASSGTLANVLVLAVCAAGYGNWRFGQEDRLQISSLLPQTEQPQGALTREHIMHLPPVVQRWLERSGAVGKPLVQRVYMRQQGRMRTTPDGSWMPFTAEEYFTIPEPGFLWLAEVNHGSLMAFRGRDTYREGRGHMLIKMHGLVPVADASGPATDQGSLLRFMGESVWFPAVAISPYLKWEQLSETTARCTMRYGGVTADGVYSFTPAGDMVSLLAKRYYDRKTGPTLEDWQVTVQENGYRAFEGIRIPASIKVVWKLETGDFHWLDMDVTEVKYNRP